MKELLEQWLQLQRKKGRLEWQLAEVNAAINRLETNLIPEEMKDEGLVEGQIGPFKVKLHTGTSVSLRKSQKEEALEWLEDNNLDYLVKREINVPLGKDQLNVSEEIGKYLKEKGYAYSVQRNVHPMTLQAEGKKLANTVQFPENLFSVYDYSKAKIKYQQPDDDEEF